MKEDGFQAFITAEVNAEDPDEVGTTEDYIDSIVQAKVNVDSDIMAVYVTRTDTDDTTSRGSGLDNIKLRDFLHETSSSVKTLD